MNKILDDLPAGPVFFLCTIFAFMPIMPEPHLWQKAMMINDGIALAPMDWFDIVLHGGAALLAVAKFLRMRQVKAQAGDQGSDQGGNANSED